MTHTNTHTCYQVSHQMPRKNQSVSSLLTTKRMLWERKGKLMRIYMKLTKIWRERLSLISTCMKNSIISYIMAFWVLGSSSTEHPVSNSPSLFCWNKAFCLKFYLNLNLWRHITPKMFHVPYFTYITPYFKNSSFIGVPWDRKVLSVTYPFILSLAPV